MLDLTSIADVLASAYCVAHAAGVTPVRMMVSTHDHRAFTPTARSLPRSTAPIACAVRSTSSASTPLSIETSSPLGLPANGARRSVLTSSAGSVGIAGRSVRASDAGVDLVAQALDRNGRQRVASNSRRDGIERIA